MCAPSDKGKQERAPNETKADKTLEKADAPSDRKRVRFETGPSGPREGGRTIQQRETSRGTVGDKGMQDPWEGRRAIQQDKTGTIGDKGRGDPKDIQEGRDTTQQRKQEGVQWEIRGDKTFGKTDAPSNKQEGVKWETEANKTLGKANASYGGLEWETAGDQAFGKADIQSNKGKQEWVQLEGDEGW